MKKRHLYSEHLEVIVALVTHLATTKYKSKTPKKLARYLSLDYEEVSYVLRTFKGLFRQSINTTSKDKNKNEEHYYTLQIRYGLRWTNDEENPDELDFKEPLEPEYLTTLLNFISSMVEQEQTNKRESTTNLATLRGAWIAAGAAILAAIFSLLK